MRERGIQPTPILFTDGNVLAIEQDRKNQTRRKIKCPPEIECYAAKTGDCSNAPYKVGDILYVKHAWRTVDPRWDRLKPREIPEGTPLEYRCDGVPKAGRRWRSPLFMREWMARTRLEITAVRAERLNDISEADAEAEGAMPCPPGYEGECLVAELFRPYACGFAQLWESIHGIGSWERNDWLWVYEFKRIKDGGE